MSFIFSLVHMTPYLFYCRSNTVACPLFLWPISFTLHPHFKLANEAGGHVDGVVCGVLPIPQLCQVAAQASVNILQQQGALL